MDPIIWKYAVLALVAASLVINVLVLLRVREINTDIQVVPLHTLGGFAYSRRLCVNAATDRARAAQQNWDDQEDPRIAAEADVDYAALEALRAAPAMLEQALGYQSPSFWAKAARLLDAHQDVAFAGMVREARDAHVNDGIEDVVDDKGLSVNGAIDHLLMERAA